VAAVVSIATVAVVGPVAGVVSALWAFAALRARVGRAVVAAASPSALAVAAVYVIARQARYHPGPALEWPGEQRAVHQLAWMAVVLLAVVVAADAQWHGLRHPKLRDSGDARGERLKLN
jgi:peptidoglycan biosynthesis protein MviN/MurJ (putative lipid II flippase)